MDNFIYMLIFKIYTLPKDKEIAVSSQTVGFNAAENSVRLYNKEAADRLSYSPQDLVQRPTSLASPGHTDLEDRTLREAKTPG